MEKFWQTNSKSTKTSVIRRLAFLLSVHHSTNPPYGNLVVILVHQFFVPWAFLFSRDGTFKVAIFNPGAQKARYYLCVMHAVSGTVIWSANRDGPISSSGKMTLTAIGITIAEQDGNDIWSTPPLRSSVNALLLTETGNLVLLDQFNRSLWESFHYPTDTIVMGQHLLEDTILSSAVSDDDLSTGDYKLTVSDSDVLLQWYGQTYWRLSMDARAYRNSNYINEYMEINGTGLFLFGRNGSAIVTQVTLPPSNFRIAQLDASGQFVISSFLGTDRKQEFVGPIDGCRIPLVCGRIGLCTGTTSNGPICSCPQGFLRGSQNSSGCAPSDGYSLPLACNSAKNVTQLNSSDVSYLKLGYGMGYFSVDFSEPIEYGVNLSVCQDFCTADCSCLGIYYQNSSGSCYAFENELGSIIASTTDDDDRLGYIKTLGGNDSPSNNGSTNPRRDFPLFILVLLPFTGMDGSNSGCGQSISSSGSGFVYFPLFALEMHEQGNYLELADPRLEGRVTSEEAERLVRVALCCVQEEPLLRPTMASVVGMLESSTPLGQPRIESLNFLRFYGRRFTEASMIGEENEQRDIILYPEANPSATNTTNDSHACFSYISSQQISGPR
uniref:G-type lectin S-receptor-like serine/threonine-protein kinase n=1 Tax=Populus alba TaxID=43335 RepID=A0A4U5QST4_POPAL|nr:G-type lectin S-receptor-like serine/threonine-protein kinase [Populus alba]